MIFYPLTSLFVLTGALLAQTDPKAAQVKEAIQTLTTWSKWSPAEKSAAIEKLKGLGGPVAAQALAARLHDKSATVRKEIALALGKLKEEKTVPVLLTAFEAERGVDGDTEVFVAMCRALGEIGDARAIPALVRGLLGGNRRDPDWKKRGEARVDALGGIRHKDAIEELMDLFTRGTSGTGRRGGGRGNNPLSSSISRSLQKLTGQKLSDQKAWHDWWQENKERFRF